MLATAVDRPRHDSEWRDFLKQRDFGQVVAMGAGRTRPVITPTHFLFDGESLDFHVHRANPLIEALSERPAATLTVVDAPCYIPSYWNFGPGEDPESAAPTSYYAAVQVSGEVRLLEGHDLADLLNRQVKHFQPEGRIACVEVGPTIFGRALRAIVGVHLRIEDVEAKFKFGGNRTVAHRLAIAERLAGRGAPNDASAVSYLLRRLRQEDCQDARTD